MLKVIPIFLVVFLVGCTTFPIPENISEPVFKVAEDTKEVHEFLEPIFDVMIVQTERAIETVEDEAKKAEYVAKLAKIKKVVAQIKGIVSKIDKVVAAIKAYNDLAVKEDEPVSP